MRYAAWLLAVLVLGSTARADGPEDELKKIRGEFQAAQKEIVKEYQAADSDAARAKLLARYRKLPNEFADKFLAFAEKHAQDENAFDALAWVVGNAPTSAAADKALDILIKQHIKSERIGLVCLTTADSPSSIGEKLSRAAIEQNPSDTVKGQATYALAKVLFERSEEMQKKKKPDAAVALTKEAEPLFEKVLDKYAETKGLRGPLGTLAKNELYELRNLTLGKNAPEIDGEDGDGKSFKLSDYKGKVVIVDFWGHWCGPCRAAYPHNRELIKRFEGKPFALLGVNSDKDKDALKKTMAKEENSWRFWFDGGSTRGPIATKYNVQGWPTFYVVDHKGVIRMRSVGSPDHAELDKLLEELVAEAGSGK